MVMTMQHPQNQPEKDAPLPGKDSTGYDDTEGLNIKACSATDFTGLIPSLPSSDADLESYAEVYHYPADIFHD